MTPDLLQQAHHSFGSCKLGCCCKVINTHRATFNLNGWIYEYVLLILRSSSSCPLVMLPKHALGLKLGVWL